jgi:hypothetical protein
VSIGPLLKIIHDKTKEIKMEKKPILKLQEPQGLCADCIEKTYQLFNDKYVFAYCEHNSSGGVYNLEKKVWSISTPVSLDDFKKAVDGLIQTEKAYEILHSQNTNETFH